MKKQMFTVDVAGLRSVLERRGGKAHALLELVQNALDADDVTEVSVRLDRVPGSRWVEVTVTDDSPQGFERLSDAYTMFRKSTKVGDATLRGMFNVGEKLVIAMMNGGSRVQSTTGTVVFDPAENTRSETKERTEAGSVFWGRLTMTREEQDEAEAKLRSVLVPAAIALYVNGEQVTHREPKCVVEAKALPCVVWDDERDALRETKRNTTINIVELGPDEEEAYLYVLGLPVMPLYEGQGYHYDVGQRVPTNLERDSVRKSVMRRINALCLEKLAGELDAEAAKATWVRAALDDEETLTPETVKAYIEAKHETKIEDCVIHDPNDPESTKRAVAEGKTVLRGGHLPKPVWGVVRSTNLILPAPMVTPSHQLQASTYGTSVDVEIPADRWTEAQRFVVPYVTRMAGELIEAPVRVRLVNDNTTEGRKYLATYQRLGHVLTLNQRTLGRSWFADLEKDPLAQRCWETLIHELAHEKVSDHLSDKFHDEIGRLGVKLARLVIYDEDAWNGAILDAREDARTKAEPKGQRRVGASS